VLDEHQDNDVITIINDKDHAYIKQEVSDLVKRLEPVM